MQTESTQPPTEPVEMPEEEKKPAVNDPKVDPNQPDPPKPATPEPARPEMPGDDPRIIDRFPPPKLA